MPFDFGIWQDPKLVIRVLFEKNPNSSIEKQ